MDGNPLGFEADYEVVHRGGFGTLPIGVVVVVI